MLAAITPKVAGLLLFVVTALERAVTSETIASTIVAPSALEAELCNILKPLFGYAISVIETNPVLVEVELKAAS